jgi:quercetin dioxygenase-like cupin family protein
MRGSLDGPDVDEPFSGVHRTSFSTAQMTVTHYRFAPGASFPRHRHDQEQVTIVQGGDVELTVAATAYQLTDGEWFVVGSQIEHGLIAGPGGAQVIAIVSPPRREVDDFKLLTSEGPGS